MDRPDGNLRACFHKTSMRAKEKSRHKDIFGPFLIDVLLILRGSNHAHNTTENVHSFASF